MGKRGPKPGTVNNPNGKGGFQERPFDIAKGRWSGETSISYQYNVLIRLSVDEFMEWIGKHPTRERTLAQEIAYNAVVKARDDLAYLKEVTDRTEGRVKQTIKHEGEVDTGMSNVADLLQRILDEEDDDAEEDQSNTSDN
jgi:hypothetical protein